MECVCYLVPVVGTVAVPPPNWQRSNRLSRDEAIWCCGAWYISLWKPQFEGAQTSYKGLLLSNVESHADPLSRSTAVHAADTQLVQRLVAGDGAAWQEFIQTHGRIIRSRAADVAASFGKATDESAVDDATAEVFVALLQNDAAALRAYKGESSLATYVAVIATRSATRGFAARRMRTANEAHGDVVDSGAPEPWQRALDDETRAKIQRVLDRLPAKQRAVVESFHLQGQSYVEISGRLGMPIGSVGVTLRRAEAKLKQLLEPD